MGGSSDIKETHSRLLDQPQKKNGPALSHSGKMGPPNYRDRGPQCTTACTRRERVVKLAHIGGRLARQAQPHQGPDLVAYDMWCRNGTSFQDMAAIHLAYTGLIIMWSVSVNPPISRETSPWAHLSLSSRTRKKGTAIIVKAVYHKCMDERDRRFKSQ